MKAFELNISTIPLLALSEYGRYCYGSQVTPFSTDKTPNLKWSKKKKKDEKKRWKSDLRWKKRAQLAKWKQDEPIINLNLSLEGTRCCLPPGKKSFLSCSWIMLGYGLHRWEDKKPQRKSKQIAGGGNYSGRGSTIGRKPNRLLAYKMLLICLWIFNREQQLDSRIVWGTRTLVY